MEYKSISTVIRGILTEETITEQHGAEEVKILSDNDEPQAKTAAEIVADRYVKKCNKAEIQKKIIDNA